MDSALIIFVKNPELGRAKTRLAKTLGDDAALEIYLKLLEKTRSVAAQVNCDKFVFYSSFVDQEDEWSNKFFNKKLQNQSSDLGERMSSAFQELTIPYAKTIIIGSDCPLISAEIIDSAFLELENTDMVIGPAMDGGYYLLGMKEFNPTLFEKINWSSESVLRQTIDAGIKSGLTYQVLEMLPDIDFEADWLKYGW